MSEVHLSEKITKLFPPPQFLEMPGVGLSVSDRSIRFLELERQHSFFRVHRYGEKKIPKGVIIGGAIQERDALVDILKEVKDEHGIIFVRMSLQEQQGYLLKLHTPHLKKSQIRNAIRFELEQHIPLSPEDVLFDYSLVQCSKNSEGLDLGVSVIPTKVVEDYLGVVKEAGLVPLSFEIEAIALARALLPDGSCDTYMIIDIGAAKTGIILASEGVVQFAWTIPIGGDKFSSIVAKQQGISFEEAKKYKEQVGLTRNEGGELLALLMPTVKMLGEEINRRSFYWQNKHVVNEEGIPMDISQIILCGGEANVRGLRENLAKFVNVPLLVGNPWTNVISFETYIPELPLEKALQYTTAIGLALRGE